VYHGPNRNSSPKFLASHDLVITTYSTLQHEPVSSLHRGVWSISHPQAGVDLTWSSQPTEPCSMSQ
jgi:hypothetical protein